jgi:hypothetical protein
VSHVRPAGWVYVAWHPKSPGYTKIGYSKAHPELPDERYTFKRVHQVGRHLVSFGFGPLECWSSAFHPTAERIEKLVQRELAKYKHLDVGPSTDMFAVDPQTAIELVRKHIPESGIMELQR